MCSPIFPSLSLRPRYFDYNRDTETLTITVSSDPHETPGRYIKQLVLGKLGEMQLKGAIGPGRATRKKGENREKEPSVSIYLLRFARPAGRIAKWPTLAIEVGVSEAAEKLELDIAFWFSKSEGDVQVRTAIHYESDSGNVDTSIWILGAKPTHANPRPASVRLQQVRLYCSQGRMVQ